MEIRDGDLLLTSKLIGKFCGSRLPPIIVSSYKYIFVKFVSDLDNYPFTRKFSATYKAIVPGKKEEIMYMLLINQVKGPLNVTYGSSFSRPCMAQARSARAMNGEKKPGPVFYSPDRENKVNKILILRDVYQISRGVL